MKPAHFLILAATAYCLGCSPVSDSVPKFGAPPQSAKGGESIPDAGGSPIVNPGGAGGGVGGGMGAGGGAGAGGAAGPGGMPLEIPQAQFDPKKQIQVSQVLTESEFKDTKTEDNSYELDALQIDELLKLGELEIKKDSAKLSPMFLNNFRSNLVLVISDKDLEKNPKAEKIKKVFSLITFEVVADSQLTDDATKVKLNTVKIQIQKKQHKLLEKELLKYTFTKIIIQFQEEPT